MRTQKQRIFSLLVLLTMVIVLTCIFVACDKGGAQDKNYTVTIHPDNGQADFVWDTKTDIPVITKYGYHIVGYYLDADMTISTTLESLKATNLTADLNVYVKWEKDSVPPKTKIVTNNLLCDYDTRALSGKVSNSTTVFSFNDEISVEKGTTYTISTDINGINVIPSKTVNLEIGDNIFYVLVSNEDELTLYTATVRRKPIYTVTFDTLGGTEVEAQQVEEDAFATAPTTEKNGCTFEKWDWDFSMPITENTTITAIWNAFVYNIVYDFNITEDSASQEVDNSMNPTTYTVDDTIYFSAPRRKGYYFTGWSVSNISKGTTGTITTTARWRLIPYEIIYDFGDSNSVSKAINNDSNPRYYCVENEINFAKPTRAGYTFVSWDKNIEKGTTGTQTVTASWDVNQYNIEYVLNGWTNNEDNKVTYTIEDPEFILQDGTNGESLFCGWYLDKEYTTHIESITPTSARDYTVYAMPDCGATNGLLIQNGVVQSYFGISDEVIIPSYYKGYDVISISESSFRNCESITNAVIPNSVTDIECGAFLGCTSLESITIPFIGASRAASNGYDQVFGYIFGYETSISKNGTIAVIPNAINQYSKQNTKDWTFVHYWYYIPTTLKNVSISDGITDIPYRAFIGCKDIKNITIPASVKSFGNSAFSGCRGITDIVIPSSTTSIGDYAFSGCKGLTDITIPDSVTTIGQNALFGCTALASIIVSENNAFYSSVAGILYDKNKTQIICVPKAIKGEISIANGVTSIDSTAFKDCIGVTSMIIPDSVERIGEGAFSGCSSLESITIPFVGAKAGVTSDDMYQYPFGYIFGTKEYDGGVWTQQWYYRNSLSKQDSTLYYLPYSLKTVTVTGGNILGGAFYNCRRLTRIEIQNDVISIGGSAFYNCSGLTNITIPDSVTSIGDSAFTYCYKLIEVYNKSSLEITAGSEDNGKVAYYAKSVYSTDGDGKLTIDDNGYVIYADGVEKILVSYNGIETELTLPYDITQIYERAFNGCAGLTSITIPNSVKSIGRYAFEGCTELTGVYITNLAKWCTIDFSWDKSNPLSYAKNLYLNQELVTDLIIPDGVRSIGSYAFDGCAGLTRIVIPDSVWNIGYRAFAGCSALTNITVANGNKNYHSVDNCLIETSSELLILGCKNSIIPTDGTVTGIYAAAFYGCKDLIGITIPYSVMNIGSSAFRECTGLTSVTIGNCVTSIEAFAFEACANLDTVYYEGDETQWNSISIDSYNDALTSAKRYYYSETEPSLTADGMAYDGNYWHYDTDGETIVVWKKEN